LKNRIAVRNKKLKTMKKKKAMHSHSSRQKLI